MKKLIVVSAVITALLVSVVTATGPGTGIVRSIVNAPVTPDGNVAGAVTDLVINLDTSMDPSVPGRSLLTGNKIRIHLPEDFTNTGLPFGSPFEGCAPGCSAGIILQGWPQHPVGFPPPTIPGKWTVYGEGTHTIVFEALQDLLPAPPAEPGIKQVHILLFGFRNPHPGHYEIRVEAETGPNGALETGSGMVHILPNPRPSINVTSIFNAGFPNPNTIYQETSPGNPTPFPYDFLMWDQRGMSLTGVEVVGNRLVRGRRTVGKVQILGPAGAVGQEVFTPTQSTQINAPVTGIPTARLTAHFQTGDLPGLYTVTFHLAGGNKMSMFVHVVE